MKSDPYRTFVVDFVKDGHAFERSSVSFTSVEAAEKYGEEHMKFTGAESFTVYEMEGIYLKEVS